ncbi:MAG: ATP-binding protein [Erythrobacter sp.]
MGTRSTIPVAGISLALLTFIAMLLLRVELFFSVAVLILWIGSLVLASARQPEGSSVTVEKKLNREAMSSLIENASTPLLVTEHNKVAIANGAARTILGSHIIGQDVRMAFRQPEAISLLAGDSDGKATVRGLVRRRDIWDINRHAFGKTMAVLELTNQTAEADLSRAHTDFVANASHELRTPLAAIIGYVETLSESGDSIDSPTSQKFLSTIQRESKRLQSLVSDLMSLSRVEAEKHDSPSEVIELWPILESAAMDAAGVERADLVALTRGQDATVLGDTQQLEQLIRNLVDNALRHGKEGSTVRIELDRTQDRQARISVANEGAGIAPEHIPHLTRRFYRTDPGRSRASGGTGLGLAIVKHIVERHRGRLDILSEIGQGTEVIVRMPLVDSNNETAEAESDLSKMIKSDAGNEELS